jgi:hypothetical protein
VVETKYLYPDDDGYKQRAWIIDSERRGITACERAFEVVQSRPWVLGDISLTVRNGKEDQMGIDFFVPVDPRILKKLGIRTMEKGIPMQVKSSDKDVVEFLEQKRLFRMGKPIYPDGEYIFVLNGQRSKDLVLADLVGQMLMLTRKCQDEDSFLHYLGTILGDKEAVARWRENKDVITDSWWYKDLLV